MLHSSFVLEEAEGEAKQTSLMSQISPISCLLPFFITEKLHEMNSKNILFEGLTHQTVVKPLMHVLEFFFFLCKATLIFQMLQTRARQSSSF